ncbi:hypothetical protein [Bradyrhizobium sp.]|uniref:hypothetical protein n=1 Tax=Bradyrhizobium sp. TaxID=376 RepID=UPI001EB7090C|nr:hypothetical protein [Bradyrhizobium sp.]MBV9983089.1 hypothetical protein [Bradyrhizobium sp.]
MREKAYWFVCQVLNLFEIIISYRKDHVVPDDVFATWVSWFHELGTSKRFERFWIDEELWSHYKGELQQILNLATGLARKREEDFASVESSYDDELKAFHDQVATIMKDPSIKEHFDKRRATQHVGAPQ